VLVIQQHHAHSSVVYRRGAMNDFEKHVGGMEGEGLHSMRIGTLQVNLGLRCNQLCTHCHLEASPQRDEMMAWPIMELVLETAGSSHCQLIDLTGGAPELSPDFRRFVSALRQRGHLVQVRTNLTVLLEPGMEDIPEFLANHQIQLVASMPCYLEENVRGQRGIGVYEKSIAAIRQLNTLGYGSNPDLPLNLVYNPGGPFLPAQQKSLEDDYRRELGSRFGIAFTRLLTITNMPLGRFRRDLDRQNKEWDYLQLLRTSFNPGTVEGLMCRHQLSIGWDGTLYDCDFNLALDLPVNHGAPDHILSFKIEDLWRRRIVTGEHCFGCTAGSGSSCRGALV
jgi:radical SAM/Cys-rich protein